MSTRKTDLAKDITAMLESGRVNHTSKYVARGRQYSSLQDDELIAAWKNSMRRMADHPDRPENLAVQRDLMAELGLRGLDAPFQDVQEDFDRYRASASAYTDQLRLDEEKWRQAGEDLVRDIEAFRRERDRPH